MQSVMYELMSELNDRSEDLERQMLSLEQRVEQLTAGFSALPAHLSATLAAQHNTLLLLLHERDAKLLSPPTPVTPAPLPHANINANVAQTNVNAAATNTGLAGTATTAAPSGSAQGSAAEDSPNTTASSC